MDLSSIIKWVGDVRLREGRAGDANARAPAPGPAGQGAPEVEAPVSAPELPWPAPRLALAEQLWGEGFVTPGGSAGVLHLVNPMGLSGADTLLLTGAGPFGAARAITTARQCWVDGYERDPVLLAAAQRRAEAAGMKKRAPTHLLDAAAKFRSKSASHALSLESVIDDDAVVPVLSGLAVATRIGGQLGMVELVASDALDDALGRRWMHLEHRLAPPPSQAKIGAELRRLGFDVRIVEDISARHTREVTGGWTGMLRAAAGQRPSVEQARAMVAEAELWMLRLKLIDGKRLRLLRWQAIRG